VLVSFAVLLRPDKADNPQGFKGIGLHFRRQKNLVVRNIVSSFVEAGNGDALKIEVRPPLPELGLVRCQHTKTQIGELQRLGRPLRVLLGPRVRQGLLRRPGRLVARL
jgi:hypothetical protein